MSRPMAVAAPQMAVTLYGCHGIEKPIGAVYVQQIRIQAISLTLSTKTRIA